MSFIETIPERDATGAAADLYEGDRATFGLLPNFTQAFSLRPEVYAAWRQLVGAVKGNMDVRRYELVTLAAARRLGSSYCMLAHGSVLADGYLEPDVVKAIALDFHTAGLDEVDTAVMELADKVAGDATAVTAADVERLRELGLSDAEIFDVVAAAAIRCFFSKVLDGLGAEPDAHYAALDTGLREALTPGPAPAGW